jgi:hypothetical protein
MTLMHRPLLCLHSCLFLCVLICLVTGANAQADTPDSAGNPFKGDYAGTSHFKSTEKPSAGVSESLVVICITDQGKFSAGYVVKSTDINFHVRGTVDKEGLFTGTIYYQGKEWGVHSGRFNKLANGDIEGFIEELPNGREVPWGRGYMLVHPMAEEGKK